MSAGEFLHGALHRPEHPAYKPIQLVVGVLIALSLLILLCEQTLYLTPKTLQTLEVIDRIVLSIFAVEVTLRIMTYRTPMLQFYRVPPWRKLGVAMWERGRYALQFFNLVDILTVLAVYPALRGLRALRLLQLLRGSHLFLYSAPLRRVMQAFRDNALLFSFAFGLLGFGTLIGGTTLFLIEGRVNPGLNRMADGYWWALVTLTTVGFGDIAPVTGLGRIVGGVLMILGMFILALFAGIVGTTLLRAFISLREDQFRMSKDVGHLVICGYDAGSRMLLRTVISEVSDPGIELIIFAHGDRPVDVPPEFRWISGDATKESELDKARISQARAVIIVGSRSIEPEAADAISILTAFTIRSYMRKAEPSLEFKRMHPLYVVAEVLDSENVEHAKAAGCDEVIETNALGFSMLTHSIFQHGTAKVMSMIGAIGHQSLWVGKIPKKIRKPTDFQTVANHVKECSGAMVIGIQRPSDPDEILNPPLDMELPLDTHLIYLAPSPELEEVE